MKILENIRIAGNEFYSGLGDFLTTEISPKGMAILLSAAVLSSVMLRRCGSNSNGYQQKFREVKKELWAAKYLPAVSKHFNDSIAFEAYTDSMYDALKEKRRAMHEGPIPRDVISVDAYREYGGIEPLKSYPTFEPTDNEVYSVLKARGIHPPKKEQKKK